MSEAQLAQLLTLPLSFFRETCERLRDRGSPAWGAAAAKARAVLEARGEDLAQHPWCAPPPSASKGRARAPAHTTGAAKREEKADALAAMRGRALELPLGLLQWRSASPSRAVQVGADGSVVLFRTVGPYAKESARFDSVADAAAAVEPPIKWKPVEARLVFGAARA